ncbi:MAG TPA: hypothetical protein DDZ83_03445 [Nitrospinae bacterium]|nr:hypothetical protein [Nitrospinota bacterium]
MAQSRPRGKGHYKAEPRPAKPARPARPFPASPEPLTPTRQVAATQPKNLARAAGPVTMACNQKNEGGRHESDGAACAGYAAGARGTAGSGGRSG